MALVISPAVDKWLTQTEVFTIVIRGYDDNGEQCKGENLSIQYGITYDGTMPDLTTLITEYSDASGIIAMTISRPCVISLYGSYARDINDPTQGVVTQEICINYEITFQPSIVSITTIYTGLDIEITDEYNPKDLLITAEMSNGTTLNISPQDCIFEYCQITQTGENLKTGVYIDPATKTSWPLEFIVIGIPKLLSLEAKYIGEIKTLGDRIFAEEVRAEGVFLIAIDTTETRVLTSDEWFFIDLPVVTEGNEGNIRIGYRLLEAIMIVPYTVHETIWLNAWYEGLPIEVGNAYDPNNVVVFLVYPSGHRIKLNWRDCVINSYDVTEEGWNWFTITYTIEFKKIKQQFPVKGIIYKNYVDLDFKVLYISNRYNNQTEDLTEVFEDYMKFEDVMVVDWSHFLTAVNALQKYGTYIVTVPKLSGLSNQYDTEWTVLCINETTLKAHISKIYNEEEEDNGEETNIHNN